MMVPFEAVSFADAIATTFRVQVTADWDVTEIQRRDGRDGYKWAVCRRGYVLNKREGWEWEPQPSSRDARFFRECRFETAQEAFDCWRAALAAGLGAP